MVCHDLHIVYGTEETKTKEKEGEIVRTCAYGCGSVSKRVLEHDVRSKIGWLETWKLAEAKLCQCVEHKKGFPSMLFSFPPLSVPLEATANLQEFSDGTWCQRRHSSISNLSPFKSKKYKISSSTTDNGVFSVVNIAFRWKIIAWFARLHGWNHKLQHMMEALQIRAKMLLLGWV